MQIRNNFKIVILIACKWCNVFKYYVNSTAISYSHCKKKYIWVKYLIYAALSQFPICRNFRIFFPAKFEFPIFQSSQKNVFFPSLLPHTFEISTTLRCCHIVALSYYKHTKAATLPHSLTVTQIHTNKLCLRWKMSLVYSNKCIFTESAHWADSVSKSRCLSVVCQLSVYCPGVLETSGQRAYRWYWNASR